jgi:hypothetical protein
MGVQQSPGNPNFKPPAAIQRARKVASADTVTRLAFPKNLASVRVVTKKAVDGGKIVNAHGVVPFQRYGGK